MLKNILNLNGAQELSKNEQQSIQGSGLNCANLPNGTICGAQGQRCCGGICPYNNPC